MKVAVVFVGTGEYFNFWTTFYASAEKYFLKEKGIKKHYFVITEHANKVAEDKHITKIEVVHLGYPLDTLLKFHYTLLVEDTLKKYDQICMLNANIVFQQAVSSTEFLAGEDEDMVFCMWEFYTNGSFPVDREKYSRSVAYTSEKEQYRKNYQGGLLVGKTPDFLEMARAIKEGIAQDLLINYIAIWHEMSFINRYVFEYKPRHRILPGSIYLAPEEWVDNPQAPIKVEREQIKLLLFNKNRFFQERGIPTNIINKYTREKINKVLYRQEAEIKAITNDVNFQRYKRRQMFLQEPVQKKILIVMIKVRAFIRNNFMIKAIYRMIRFGIRAVYRMIRFGIRAIYRMIYFGIRVIRKIIKIVLKMLFLDGVARRLVNYIRKGG